MPKLPYHEHLGAEIVRRVAGEVDVALALEPHHLNRRGVVHGGVLTALLDAALGGAVVSSIPEEWWCATTSLSTQFLDGTGSGRLLTTGRVVRRGGRVAFVARSETQPRTTAATITVAPTASRHPQFHFAVVEMTPKKLAYLLQRQAAVDARKDESFSYEAFIDYSPFFVNSKEINRLFGEGTVEELADDDEVCFMETNVARNGSEEGRVENSQLHVYKGGPLLWEVRPKHTDSDVETAGLYEKHLSEKLSIGLGKS